MINLKKRISEVNIANSRLHSCLSIVFPKMQCILKKILFMLILQIILEPEGANTCPSECSCSSYYSGIMVNCNSKRLGFIPSNIPNNTVYINLYSNALITLDVPVCQLAPRLETFYARSNSISEIPNGFFTDCLSLQTLDLSWNSIYRINPEAFTNNSSLKNLRLEYNKIYELDVEICQLFPELETLDINSNKIMELTNVSFSGCQKLRTLDFSGNQLSVIPVGAFPDTHSLKFLDLSYNNISKIDDNSFAAMQQLQSLTLYQNKLTMIGESTFGNLPALQSLDLRYNAISLIAMRAFGLLTSLEMLFLDGNPLSVSGYDFLQFCNNIKHLRLEGTRRNDSHMFINQEDFQHMQKLQTLYISSNELSVFNTNFFRNATSLNQLYLGRNNIPALDFEFCSLLPKLTILDLSGNQIANISNGFFRGCNNLSSLDLSRNLIAEILSDFFMTNYYIRSLVLSFNKISKIEDNSFTELHQLQNLVLSFNKISKIEDNSFTELHQLQNLDIKRNELIRIDALTFANTTALLTLDLSVNVIEFVHPEAFLGVKNLQKLLLTGNPVSNGGYTFLRHCKSLYSLYLDNTRDNESHSFINSDDMQFLSNLRNFYISNNLVTELDSRMFQNTTNLYSLLMYNNKLTVIKENTFINLNNLYTINLSNNNISRIEDNAFGQLPRLYYLHLFNNPLLCDCDIEPFWKWLYPRKSIITSARCSNGTLVRDLSSIGLLSCNTSIPFVEAILIEGPLLPIPVPVKTPSLLPAFRCMSVDMRKMRNGTSFYDMYWYIDGDLILEKINQSIEDTDSPIMRNTDWIETHRLNMEVQCAVRIRNSTDGSPGPYIYSPIFHAGLIPDKYEYTVMEGEPINITFSPTVPVGCIASYEPILPQCDRNIYVFQPKYINEKVPCINDISNKDVVFGAEFCGLRLKTSSWSEKKNLTVYGFNDGIYNYKPRTTFIRLSTSAVADSNDIWKNLQVPDIKVTVIDRDTVMLNRLCQIHNDPHVRTFDGRVYDYMDVGEYVMYRNDKGPYAVNVLFSACDVGISGATCNCGVAIRSRNSLFIFRTCQTISKTNIDLLQQPVIRHVRCDDNDMFIEQSMNIYKIRLPHGTEIKLTINRFSRLISGISIKPSVFDLNDARGLCGVPNLHKDISDDFTLRGSGKVNNAKTFGDSWRVTPEMTKEQLFVDAPTFFEVEMGLFNEVNTTFQHYCSCEKQAGSTDNVDDFYTLHCNMTETTGICTDNDQLNVASPGPVYDTCADIQLKRRRRSVISTHIRKRRNIIDNTDDIVDSQPLVYDEDVFSATETAPETFRNGWTYDRAYTVCSESIQNALPKDLYEDYMDVPEGFFIESCVKDIELTADTLFLSDTISAMTTFILTEALRNEFLYLQNKTGGSQSILQYLTSQLCPNNCSNNGDCQLGVCSCVDGYTGEDCSQDTSTPPNNISLPANGLCNIATRTCRRTNVYGDFSSTRVWSQLRHFQIINNDIVYTSHDETISAEYRNMFMVTVTLPSSRRKRSTSTSTLPEGYEIRLSNDGVNYGDSVNILIYDDNCYSCNATSTNFSCVYLDGCKLSTITPENGSQMILIAVGLTAGILVAIGVVGAVKLICAKSKNNKSSKVVDMFSGINVKKVGHDNGNQRMNKFLVKRSNTIIDLELI